MPIVFAQKSTRNRSSETDKYVTKEYTKQNPKTTVSESGGNTNRSARSRSAESGRCTTKSYSNSNSKTTVVEHPRSERKK